MAMLARVSSSIQQFTIHDLRFTIHRLNHRPEQQRQINHRSQQQLPACCLDFENAARTLAQKE
jgi:hypothetical protein